MFSFINNIFNKILNFFKFKNKDTQESVDFINKRITDINANLNEIILYLGSIPAQCDKCNSYFDNEEKYCFKCEGTGVVKNSQLNDWPW
jgi:hypothetical protein